MFKVYIEKEIDLNKKDTQAKTKTSKAQLCVFLQVSGVCMLHSTISSNDKVGFYIYT
jgi:hypothetical protein